MRVHFSNIKGFLVTTGSLLGSRLPQHLFVPFSEMHKKRILKLSIYQRFIFLVFQNKIRAWYTETVVYGHLLLGLFAMLIADQS